uniref:Uncharacterized protein n=1 Tax=Echeneis naucrates TaxID=173247 RepID=A0A665VBQ9_ECHNA
MAVSTAGAVVTLKLDDLANGLMVLRPPSSSSGCSPRKHKKERKRPSNVEAGYQQPTVSSRTRALSPYTHRKMCQLTEDARQRLSHLQMGPHHFRKETESQPPFLTLNMTVSCNAVFAYKRGDFLITQPWGIIYSRWTRTTVFLFLHLHQI